MPQPLRRFGRCLSIVLLLATPTAAQDQGGGIQGVVRDASRAVLPGATIEARSPSMPGVQAAVSGGDGVYRFPILRPGTYELTATLSGFTPVQVPGVVVRLGAEFRIDIAMEVARLAETVQVTAETPVIDVRQNAAIATISDDALKLLPARGRDFTDMLTMSAGVQNVDSGISIDGASGLENHYIVDGVKTTAILTGSSAQPVRNFRAAANDPQGLNNLRSDPFYKQPRSSGAGASPYQSRRTFQFSARYRF